MTVEEAKNQGFTHYAKMYGIYGFVKYEDEGLEFRGHYWLTDQIYEAILYLDMLVGFNEQGFKCTILGAL